MFRQVIPRSNWPEKIDKKDKHSIAPVDQFPAQDFCLGENGFVRSPLSVALRTQDEKLRQAILSRINERDVVDNSGKSDDELIKDLVPRSVQTPSEILAYTKLFNEMYPAEPPMTVDSEPVIPSSEPVITPVSAS